MDIRCAPWPQITKPVVTNQGGDFPRNVCTLILVPMSCRELCAQSVEKYEEILLRLLTDSNYRGDLNLHLPTLRLSTSAFNTKIAAKQLYAVILKCVRKFLLKTRFG